MWRPDPTFRPVRPVADHLVGTEHKIMEREETQLLLGRFKSVVGDEHDGGIFPDTGSKAKFNHLTTTKKSNTGSPSNIIFKLDTH